MSKIDATNVSTKDLAAILGMTRDGVTRLCRNGIITQNGVARGKYDLLAAVSSYVKHMRETHGETAEVRLAIQRTRKLQLQNDKTEAGLVKVSAAAIVFATFMAIFRDDVKSRIKGLAANISKTDNPREVAKIMQAEFNAIGQAANDTLKQVEEIERNN